MFTQEVIMIFDREIMILPSNVNNQQAPSMYKVVLSVNFSPYKRHQSLGEKSTCYGRTYWKTDKKRCVNTSSVSRLSSFLCPTPNRQLLLYCSQMLQLDQNPATLLFSCEHVLPWHDRRLLHTQNTHVLLTSVFFTFTLEMGVTRNIWPVFRPGESDFGVKNGRK